MRSIKNISDIKYGNMVVSDEVVEYHAARLMLLLFTCGINDRATGYKRIDGLTKLAKLDFFVRYPEFFEEAAQEEGLEVSTEADSPEEEGMVSQPSMTRHHYGPWDHRYYHVLAYLTGKGLLKVQENDRGNGFEFYLTDSGQELSEQLKESGSFDPLVGHMEKVNNAFRRRSGNQLKNLIYRVFDEEIAELELGESIE